MKDLASFRTATVSRLCFSFLFRQSFPIMAGLLFGRSDLESVLRDLGARTPGRISFGVIHHGHVSRCAVFETQFHQNHPMQNQSLVDPLPPTFHSL